MNMEWLKTDEAEPIEGEHAVILVDLEFAEYRVVVCKRETRMTDQGRISILAWVWSEDGGYNSIAVDQVDSYLPFEPIHPDK